jgi:hypothetical protein
LTMWLLVDRVSTNNRQSKINNGFTGPSTNGRSSAFGALCLGSNPSGPARKAFSSWPLALGLKPKSGRFG